MTKEQHIAYWDSQVDEDFDCAEVLFQANHFAQSLFWAHLAVEKLCKALCVKENDGNTVPLIHNLLRLTKLTTIDFTDEELGYFSEMNTFQIKGRYPEYVQNLDQTITKEICSEYLIKTKNMILCLRSKMQ